MTASQFRHADISATVARHYGELDEFYREVWGPHLHHGLWRTGHESPERAVEALVEHVAESVRLAAGEVVVDVGAGYGEAARLLATRYDVHVTGVTVTPAQHAYAERHTVDDRVRILLQDWLDNTITSGSADVAIAVESTEHMADLPLALREMRRVLRPGGRVAVCAWLAAEDARPWARRWLLDPIREEGRLASLPTARRLLALMREVGFEQTTLEDLTPRVARTWSICLRRLVGRTLTDSRYLRYGLNRRHTERVFLAAMLRILAAYRVGAMQYGLFVGRAPA
jgi:tocopherol O-methyltransferase